MLTSLVSSAVEFLTAHPRVAYLAVFLLALSSRSRSSASSSPAPL
ncbi:hypothetical protein ACVOMV_26045 (plasmid) [Mesorhizobium atlanticum]